MPQYTTAVSLLLSPAEEEHVEKLFGTATDGTFVSASRRLQMAVAAAATGKLPDVATVSRTGHKRQVITRMPAELYEKLCFFSTTWRCSKSNALRRCLGLPPTMQGPHSWNVRHANPDLLPSPAVPLVMRKVATVKMPSKRGAR